jgi:hypothetical protein
MIPFSFGGAIMSVVSGVLVTKLGVYRPIIWFGWIVMTLGWGLMIQLDDTSNNAEKVLYLLVAALGIGCLFQVRPFFYVRGFGRWLTRFVDTINCTASRYAVERYGNINRDVRFPSVCSLGLVRAHDN